jgi:peptidoglycan/LPS O-acetylase OafA/YrhL
LEKAKSQATSHLYLPALDGVRGLAIILVMALHLFAVQFGWVGVDLFFVLSGFLITGILYDTKAETHYFKNFYGRRALRIFPLYYGYLFFYALAIRYFAHSAQPDLAQEIPWVAVYATNILIAKNNNFITSSINHFWTLAIEEQFYLVWPTLVYFLSRKRMITVSLILCAVVLISRCYLCVTQGPSYAIYVTTAFRLDEFALGGILALLLRGNLTERESVHRHAKSFLLISGILISSIFAYRGYLSSADILLQSFGFTLIGIFFTAFLAFALNNGSQDLMGRILRSKILTLFGKYSYALYVFHLPILIALQMHWQDHSFVGLLMLGCLVGVVSCLVAFLSWHLYEKHFIRLKDRFFRNDVA